MPSYNEYLNYYKRLLAENPDIDRDEFGEGLDVFHENGSSPGFFPTPEQITAVGRQRMSRKAVKLSDFTNELIIGGAGLGQGAGFVAKRVGLETLGGGIEKYFEGVETGRRKQLSPNYQIEAAKTFYRDDPETGEEVLKPMSEWPGLTAIGGKIAQSIPGTLAGMGVGIGVGLKLAPVLTKMFGLSEKLAVAVGGAVGGWIGEGGVSGVDAARDAYNTIMSAPIGQLGTTPEFQQYYSEFGDEEIARKKVAEDVSTKTGLAVGALVGAMGAPTGAVTTSLAAGVLRRPALQFAKTRLGTVAFSGVGNAGQEAGQSPTERYAQNIVRQRYADPSVSPYMGLKDAALTGAITGGVMGAGVGGAAYRHDTRMPTDIPSPVDPLPTDIPPPVDPPPPEIPPPIMRTPAERQAEIARLSETYFPPVPPERMTPEDRQNYINRTADTVSPGDTVDEYAARFDELTGGGLRVPPSRTVASGLSSSSPEYDNRTPSEIDPLQYDSPELRRIRGYINDRLARLEVLKNREIRTADPKLAERFGKRRADEIAALSGEIAEAQNALASEIGRIRKGQRPAEEAGDPFGQVPPVFPEYTGKKGRPSSAEEAAGVFEAYPPQRPAAEAAEAFKGMGFLSPLLMHLNNQLDMYQEQLHKKAVSDPTDKQTIKKIHKKIADVERRIGAETTAERVRLAGTGQKAQDDIAPDETLPVPPEPVAPQSATSPTVFSSPVLRRLTNQLEMYQEQMRKKIASAPNDSLKIRAIQEKIDDVEYRIGAETVAERMRLAQTENRGARNAPETGKKYVSPEEAGKAAPEPATVKPPQGNKAEPSVPLPLTPAAVQLLKDAEKGIPSIVTPSLAKIATENGIEVGKTDTPEDHAAEANRIVAELRRRAVTAAVPDKVANLHKNAETVSKAARIRELADKMENQIQKKLNPAVGNQNPTAKRARQAASSYANGEALRRQQAILYRIADELEAGTLPEVLQKFGNRSVIETVLRYNKFDNAIRLGDYYRKALSELFEKTKGMKGFAGARKTVSHLIAGTGGSSYTGTTFLSPDDIAAVEKLNSAEFDPYKRVDVSDAKRLYNAGIDFSDKFDEAKRLLESYIKPPSEAETKAKKIKAIEDSLIGQKDNDFFPTPRPVIDRMIEAAQIKPGDRVLEPSAGKGDIADAVKEQFPDNPLETVEVSGKLSDLLDMKGHKVTNGDFLETQAEADKILMNPPFSKNQDIQHVRHAYGTLAPGGRIVAIMSEGAFSRTGKTEASFREWLDEVGGTSEKLPEKSFTGKEAFNQTGVASRLVIIDKGETGGESGTPVPGQGDESITGKIAAAYGKVVSRTGFKNVEIAELQKESGVPMKALKDFLRAEAKAGRATLSFGDWSLSSEGTRSGVIEIGDTKYLLVRFNETAKETGVKPAEAEKSKFVPLAKPGEKMAFKLIDVASITPTQQRSEFNPNRINETADEILSETEKGNYYEVDVESIVPPVAVAGESMSDAEIEAKASEILKDGLNPPMILRRLPPKGDSEQFEIIRGAEDYPAVVKARQMDPRKGEMFNAFVIEKNGRPLGLTTPIVVKQTGPESFEVISGNLEYWGAAEARRRDPRKGEMVNAFVKPESALGKKSVNLNPKQLGKEDVIYNSRMEPVRVQYAVVDAETLIPSHHWTNFSPNSKYPQEYQNRGRDSAALQVQVEGIARNPVYSVMSKSGITSSGAPIVDKGMVVLDGNGRVMAIQKGYRYNKTVVEDGYKADFIKDSGTLGIDHDYIDIIPNPVLVRLLLDAPKDMAEFARELGRSQTATLSDVERAKDDSFKIPDSILSLFNDKSELTSKSNQPFVNAFLEKVGVGASAELLTPSGVLSKAGERRLENFLFEKAYKNEDIIRWNVENPDPDVKRVLNALREASGSFAKARSADPTLGEFAPILDSIIEAAEFLRKSRTEGIPLDYILEPKQIDIFSGEVPKPASVMTKEFAEFFERNLRSGKRIEIALRSAGKDIFENLKSAKQTGDILRKDARQIVSDAIQRGDSGIGLNQITMYSVAGSTASVSVTEADIKAVLPKGMTVTAGRDGSFEVVSEKGGLNPFKIEFVPHIPIDPEVYRQTYGEEATPEIIESGAAASWENGRMLIAPGASKYKITHELTHALLEAGLMTYNDARAVLNAAGNTQGARKLTRRNLGEYEEQIAEWLEQNREAKDKVKPLLRQIIDRITDFIDRLVNLVHRTGRGVARDMETGKMFKNTPESRKAAAGPSYSIFGKKPKAGTVKIADVIPGIRTEVADRMTKAQGIVPASLKNRVMEAGAKAYRMMTRAYEHLGPEWGHISDKFRLAQDIQSRAEDLTANELNAITKPLKTDRAMLVFSLHLHFENILKDMDEGLIPDTAPDKNGLMFGLMNRAEVEQYNNSLKAEIANTKDIQDALALHDKFQKTLTEDLVAWGILKEKALDDKRYLHHQILIYNSLDAVNRRLMLRKGAGHGYNLEQMARSGFQKARKGSFEDYNLNYLQAQYAVISDGLAKIAKLKFLKEIQGMTDVMDTVMAKVRSENDANIAALEAAVPLIAEDLLKFRQTMAIAVSQIQKMADDGILTYDPKYKDVVKAFAAAHRAKSPVSHPDFMAFMAHFLEAGNSGYNGGDAATVFFSTVGKRRKYIKDTLGSAFMTSAKIAKRDYPTFVFASPDQFPTYYSTFAIPDRIAELVHAGEMGLPEKLQRVFVKAPTQKWLIPQEVAATLVNFGMPEDTHPVSMGSKYVLNEWKKWTLRNPWRFPKYTFTNFVGDTDVSIAVDPGILAARHSKPSADLAWAVFTKKPLTPEQEQFRERAKRLSVEQANYQSQEIQDMAGSVSYQEYLDLMTGKTASLPEKYYRFVDGFNQMRESILRYAAFRRAEELIAQGRKPGENLNWASKPEELRAMVKAGTPSEEIAAKIARESIGDYGNLSVAGKWLRSHLIPFYSWLEINAPRYVRLMRSAAAEGRSVKYLTMTGITKGTKAAARMAALSALVILFNKRMHPDEEDELGDAKRRQLHLILGKNEAGEIMTVKIGTAFFDMLDWVSATDFPSDIDDVMSGRVSFGEKAKESLLEAPVSKFILGIRPDVSLPAELLGGMSRYPDPFAPRAIRDKWEHFARTLSLEQPYRWLAGKPKRGEDVTAQLWNDFLALGTYTSDPGQQAYYDTRRLAQDFLRKENVQPPTMIPTDRQNALYYYKQALKYGDLKAARKYLTQYREMGGKPEGLKRSMSAAHPLDVVPVRLRKKFRREMTPEQRTKFDRAVNWFKKTY